MSTTIDHLRIDHRVTVLRAFTDAAGITLRAGDSGILRQLAFDQVRMEIHLGIEREGRTVVLRFPLKAKEGPRNGHMREYFELGDHVPVPGTERARPERAARKMIVPPKTKEPGRDQWPDWAHAAKKLEDSGDLKAAEELIRKNVQHIGCAASIAEMYARRMRMFQRAGNEPRAIEAFRKAVDWMGNYAASATSGGEGEALSRERDEFQAALAREFGYDPT